VPVSRHRVVTVWQKSTRAILAASSRPGRVKANRHGRVGRSDPSIRRRSGEGSGSRSSRIGACARHHCEVISRGLHFRCDRFRHQFRAIAEGDAPLRTGNDKLCRGGLGPVEEVDILACLLAGRPSRAFVDDDEGFVRLFNGRNLNGWDVDARDKSSWRVEDGLIVRREGHWPPIYLRTTSAYADFELRSEYKLHGAAYCSVAFWNPVESPSQATSFWAKGSAVRVNNDDDSLGLVQEQLAGSLSGIVGPTRTGVSRLAG
jgi:Domain of Unknown Function (DUF1080)